MTAFRDLSHVIESGMMTYRGLPPPLICDYLSRAQSRAHYAPGTEFHIGRIDMVANTGTYLDSPFHRFAEGADVAELALARLADLDTVVFRIPPAAPRAIGADVFMDGDIGGKAVLIHTGWDRYWGQERYFEDHPFLTKDAAQCLRRKGVGLVGIDSLNIDNTEDGARPVHTELLGHEILIVEHLTRLETVPESGARFFAVPPAVRGMGTFPVRAFCLV